MSAAPSIALPGTFVTATVVDVPAWRSSAVTVSGVAPEAEMPTASVPGVGGVGVAPEAYSAQAAAQERRGGQGGEARAAHADEDDPVEGPGGRKLVERPSRGTVRVQGDREPLGRRQHVGEKEVGLHASNSWSTSRGA